jgi:hypothetical protein
MVKEMALEIMEYKAPDHLELVSKAKEHLKASDPKEHKRLEKEIKLQEYAELAANMTEEYAKNLIASGEAPPSAWNRAIRQEILGSETD